MVTQSLTILLTPVETSSLLEDKVGQFCYYLLKYAIAFCDSAIIFSNLLQSYTVAIVHHLENVTQYRIEAIGHSDPTDTK